MNIQWVGSPNYTPGRSGTPITEIVIHGMAGTLAGTDQVFQDMDRNTSSHYGIESYNIHQYVQEGDTAYHAGVWSVNERSVGIEHSANADRNATDATYATSINLCVDIFHRNPGLRDPFTQINPHNKYFNTACPVGVDVNRIRQGVKEVLQGEEMSPTRKKLTPQDCVNRYKNFAGIDIKPTDPACQNRYEDPQSDEFLYGLLIQVRDLRIAAERQVIELQTQLKDRQQVNSADDPKLAALLKAIKEYVN